MATNTPVDTLLAQLRETLKEELRAEVRAEIIAELQGGTRPAAKAKGKPGPKPKTSKTAPAPKASGTTKTPDPTSLLTVIPGQRRTASDVAGAAGEITAYLKKNPGSRVDQISASFGVPVKDLQLPIAYLLKHKKVTKKGKLRGTSYTAKG